VGEMRGDVAAPHYEAVNGGLVQTTK
jgi:hypothetical protein